VGKEVFTPLGWYGWQWHDGSGMMAVPEMRATALAEFVQPVKKKGLRMFLGCVGYY